MCDRGAVSPRSDSPIGPAPTRVPRIALPPAMAILFSDPDLHEQSGPDDRDHPDRADEQREPVEVLLHDARPGQAGLHPAAEQAGQPASPATVQEDQQHQQHAGDDQHDLQGELHPILNLRLTHYRQPPVRAREPEGTRAVASGCHRSAGPTPLPAGRESHIRAPRGRDVAPPASPDSGSGPPAAIAHSCANSSASRLAPPTRAPSMSGSATISPTVFAFTDPP